ncbi:hypothetical protein [Streptomyces sp. NEAU-W12]|uniref:hypothetical protein n=1 Tax=Streptomyces sp. NEAU-W12 TaxID=2994668 RepID=UPI00224AEF05|nr:hypothetical protein [Streptomyces sp. NEAU-W12]MCX2923022.1 hypothetical protein [Streptomyces sp. NEAU-W12]
MSASRTHGSTVTRVVRERLLRPVWNSLVAYGAIWLPPDQNPFWQQYRYEAAPEQRPVTPEPVPGGNDTTESGRTTLSAS